MKYSIIVLLAFICIANRVTPDIYTCKNARISLFSTAPIEDIKAVSGVGASVYNSISGELNFSVPIRSFQFDKSLMQEHFNSDYMESDKFPRASFKGKLQEQPDLTKDGSYPIMVSGALTIHGVTQNRTIPGVISVKNGAISMTSEFMVRCIDHHIDIPQIVFHHIAESIKINVSAVYSPYK